MSRSRATSLRTWSRMGSCWFSVSLPWVSSSTATPRPLSAFFSSWAMAAAVLPMAANRPCSTSSAWACSSCRVRSRTRASSVAVMLKKARSRSPSSSVRVGVGTPSKWPCSTSRATRASATDGLGQGARVAHAKPQGQRQAQQQHHPEGDQLGVHVVVQLVAGLAEEQRPAGALQRHRGEQPGPARAVAGPGRALAATERLLDRQAQAAQRLAALACGHSPARGDHLAAAAVHQRRGAGAAQVVAQQLAPARRRGSGPWCW